MKKYRLIKVRNPRLRYIRYNLRRFLLHLSGEKMQEIMDAIDEVLADKSLTKEERDERYWQLSKELDELRDLRLKTPLYCQGCASSNFDMIYDVGMASWFCEYCYQEFREFERKRGKDYRKIYPDYERI